MKLCILKFQQYQLIQNGYHVQSLKYYMYFDVNQQPKKLEDRSFWKSLLKMDKTIKLCQWLWI